MLRTSEAICRDVKLGVSASRKLKLNPDLFKRAVNFTQCFILQLPVSKNKMISQNFVLLVLSCGYLVAGSPSAYSYYDDADSDLFPTLEKAGEPTKPKTAST